MSRKNKLLDEGLQGGGDGLMCGRALGAPCKGTHSSRLGGIPPRLLNQEPVSSGGYTKGAAMSSITMATSGERTTGPGEGSRDVINKTIMALIIT